MPSHYVALARALNDLMGFPVCLVNRERVIDEMAEEWIKIAEPASYSGRLIVPRDSEGGRTE